MKRIVAAACAICLAATSSGAIAGPSERQPGRADCIRALVLLVGFPDLEYPVGRAYAEKRFFGDLDHYIREMSCGTKCLSGDVSKGWLTMPRPFSEYRISSRNLEVDKSRVRDLIEDALNSVDGLFDLDRYDLVALFHDVDHILGGTRDGRRAVPCLYDHDLQAKPGPMRETFLEAAVNMGFWDPMSCHYYEWDSPPPGISSWTKLRRGWLDPSRVRVVRPGEKTEVLLGTLEGGSAETLAVKMPLSEKTYYLFENRQPIGYDRNLPGKGMLVMYADDDVAECRRGRSPVKLVPADPSASLLRGAAYLPGGIDVFRDPDRGVTVRVGPAEGNALKLTFGP